MAASKTLARFRQCLIFPILTSRCPYLSENKKDLTVHIHQHFLTLQLLDLICCHFMAAKQHIPQISHAEDLAVVCGCLKPGQLGMAGYRALFAHLQWPGTHPRMDCPVLPVSFLLCKTGATLIHSRNWEDSCHGGVGCRLRLSTWTSLGLITCPEDWGSIPQTFVEAQRYWQST